jgi:hypothetical protein
MQSAFLVNLNKKIQFTPCRCASTYLRLAAEITVSEVCKHTEHRIITSHFWIADHMFHMVLVERTNPVINRYKTWLA